MHYRVFNALNGSYPYAMHANGPLKDVLLWLNEIQADCQDTKIENVYSMPGHEFQSLVKDNVVKKIIVPREDLHIHQDTTESEKCLQKYSNAKHLLQFCY